MEADPFIKSSTAELFQFSSTMVELFILKLGICLQFHAFRGFLEIIFSQDLYLKSLVVWQHISWPVQSVFTDNNLVPFQIWWVKTLLKDKKKGKQILKCFVTSCRYYAKNQEITDI